MNVHKEIFQYELSSVAQIADSQAQFYETPLQDLMQMIFNDYLDIASGDITETRLVNTQQYFKEMLENLHARHKNPITGYFLSEFKRVVDKSNHDRDLRMAS